MYPSGQDGMEHTEKPGCRCQGQPRGDRQRRGLTALGLQTLMALKRDWPEPGGEGPTTVQPSEWG